MQEPESPKFQLSVLQVIAGALAAVTAAAVASTLGVAGTLSGAAVMSIIATVGSALYNHSFEQARTQIRMRRNPRTGTPAPTVLVPAPPRRIAWGGITGMAGLVFVLALGGITAVEVVARRPLATIVRAPPAPHAGGPPPVTAGTTLGQILQSTRNTATRVTPTPAGPAQTPAVTATPAAATPAAGTPPQGTPTPVATPTAPSADGQPPPSLALPEPTPLPTPPDTSSPPAEPP
jgi:hypothetical protein